MGFHVRLALHVKAVPVAKVEHVRIVRVVRRPERIEIAAFHEAHVFFHFRARDGASVHGRGVVAVDALELYRLSVDEDLSVGREADGLYADLASANVVARRQD